MASKALYRDQLEITASQPPPYSAIALPHEHILPIPQTSKSEKEVLATFNTSSDFSNREAGESEDNDVEEVDEAQDDAVIEKALDFARHSGAPPPPAYAIRLQKPVAVPQVSPTTGAPFARCYSPALASYNIRSVEFVEFIDNLNILLAYSPPLATLNMAGRGLGLVHNPIVQLAGGVTKVVAGVANFAIIKTQVSRYLQRANAEYFELRGLKVQLKTTEEMARVCGARLDDLMIRPLRLSDDTYQVRPLDRRLEAVEPYIAPLSLDVPPPAEQKAMLARVSAWQGSWTSKQVERQTMKKRAIVMRKMERGKSARGVSEDQEVKNSAKGRWVVIRSLDEARAEEAEEELRKASSLFAFLSTPNSRSPPK